MKHEELLKILKARFEKNIHRHMALEWEKIERILETNTQKLGILNKMEKSGGEPDLVGYDKKTEEYIFCDRRLDTVFTYHNSAESYYGSRGFRGFLRV